MSLGANLLSIFVPSYFFTVTNFTIHQIAFTIHHTNLKGNSKTLVSQSSSELFPEFSTDSSTVLESFTFFLTPFTGFSLGLRLASIFFKIIRVIGLFFIY